MNVCIYAYLCSAPTSVFYGPEMEPRQSCSSQWVGPPTFVNASKQSPQNVPTSQPNLESPSLRVSSRVILDYMKLTIKANCYTSIPKR